MCVSHKYKLCFVHIPKTGGVSICEALKITEAEHAPSSKWAEKYPDYKLFTVLRGHKERCDSMARYIKNPPIGSGGGKSLELFAKPLDHYLDVHCHYYLRFERLQEDFDAMMQELGFESLGLPKLNVTK